MIKRRLTRDKSIQKPEKDQDQNSGQGQRRTQSEEAEEEFRQQRWRRGRFKTVEKKKTVGQQRRRGRV